MFDAIPSYARFRTLALTDPRMVGEDVFALQRALLECGAELPSGADGVFGEETRRAVVRFQKGSALLGDGLAGGRTQRALAARLAHRATVEFTIARGALIGQLDHESSCRLGMYSP